MALLLTIRAAFDIDDIEELEAIGECAREALDTLRGGGTARVDNARFDARAAAKDIIESGTGIREFKFELPAPTKVRIEFE